MAICAAARVLRVGPVGRARRRSRSGGGRRSSASRASACASARTSASCARLRCRSRLRTRASLRFQFGRGGRSGKPPGLPRLARTRPRRGSAIEPRLGLGQRGQPRGVARQPRARPWRACHARLSASRCASRQRVAGFGLRPAAAAVSRPARLRPPRRLPSTLPARRSVRHRCRRDGSCCASRRAAPVGALAAAAKPSQRHRSPSRETSRWPGLSNWRACTVAQSRRRRSARGGAPVPAAP